MYIKVPGLDRVTFAICFQLPKVLQSHGGTYWHYFKDKETEAQRLAHSQAHIHFHSQFLQGKDTETALQIILIILQP